MLDSYTVSGGLELRSLCLVKCALKQGAIAWVPKLTIFVLVLNTDLFFYHNHLKFSFSLVISQETYKLPEKVNPLYYYLKLFERVSQCFHLPKG